jgi:hypothetical protein
MGIDMDSLAAEARAEAGKAGRHISQARIAAMTGFRPHSIRGLTRHIGDMRNILGQSVHINAHSTQPGAWDHPGRAGWWGPVRVAAVQKRIWTLRDKPTGPDNSLSRRVCIRLVEDLVKHMHAGWKAGRWLHKSGNLPQAQQDLIRDEVALFEITPEEAHGALGVCDEALVDTVASYRRLILMGACGEDTMRQIVAMHKLVRRKRHYLEEACTRAGDIAMDWMDRGWVRETDGQCGMVAAQVASQAESWRGVEIHIALE